MFAFDGKKLGVIPIILLVFCLKLVDLSSAEIPIGLSISPGQIFDAKSGEIDLASGGVDNKGTLNSAGAKFSLGGDWLNTGLFSETGTTTGLVTLNSTTGAQTVNTGGAASAFNSLVITNTHPSGVTFADALHCVSLNTLVGVKKLIFSTTGIHNVSSNFGVNGSLGNLITLTPDVPETTWNIDTPSTSVTFLSIDHSVQANGKLITAFNSIDGGNNINWSFRSNPTLLVDLDVNSPGVQNVGTIPVDRSMLVDIVIADVDILNPVNAFEFDLDYDGVVVNATNASDGGFLVPPIYEVENDLDNLEVITTSVNFAEASLDATGSFGAGVLATLSFDAISIGVSQLSINNVILSTGCGLPVDMLNFEDAIIAVVDPIQIPIVNGTDFSDIDIGGTTFGSFIDLGPSGTSSVTVTDEPNPAGVRIVSNAPAGQVPATISFCGDAATIELAAGEEIVATCGSVTIQVLNGIVEIVFLAANGSTATTSLIQGDALTFEPTSFTISVPPTNSSTAVVQISGQASPITIEPGQDVQLDEPTLIKLVSFGAKNLFRKVYLTWVTSSEIDTAGFNLLRTEGDSLDFSNINESIIIAKGDNLMDTNYSFIDSDVVSGKTYNYQLESVDFDGTRQIFGPVTVKAK